MRGRLPEGNHPISRDTELNAQLSLSEIPDFCNNLLIRPKNSTKYKQAQPCNKKVPKGSLMPVVSMAGRVYGGPADTTGIMCL